MSTQVATNKSGTLKQLISGDKFKGELAKTLPRHLSPERFARIALTALTRTPKLADCTQASLFKCLLDLSSVGLEPDGRHAHLIPYGKEATLIIDYKGLVRLIRQSGEVSTLHADVVYEKDHFDYEQGSNCKLVHKPHMQGDRGKPICVYSYCKMKDGGEDFDVMTVSDVEKVRKSSRAGQSGPWKDHWGEMAKKTILRRHSKMLPLSFELIEKVTKDDEGLAPQSGGFGNASSPDPFKPEAKQAEVVDEDVDYSTETKPEAPKDEPAAEASADPDGGKKEETPSSGGEPGDPDELANLMMDVDGLGDARMRKSAIALGILPKDYSGSVMEASPEQVGAMIRRFDEIVNLKVK